MNHAGKRVFKKTRLSKVESELLRDFMKGPERSKEMYEEQSRLNKRWEGRWQDSPQETREALLCNRWVSLDLKQKLLEVGEVPDHIKEHHLCAFENEVDGFREHAFFCLVQCIKNDTVQWTSEEALRIIKKIQSGELIKIEKVLPTLIKCVDTTYEVVRELSRLGACLDSKSRVAHRAVLEQMEGQLLFESTITDERAEENKTRKAL
jgi:hypothetical protein